MTKEKEDITKDPLYESLRDPIFLSVGLGLGGLDIELLPLFAILLLFSFAIPFMLTIIVKLCRDVERAMGWDKC